MGLATRIAAFWTTVLALAAAFPSPGFAIEPTQASQLSDKPVLAVPRLERAPTLDDFLAMAPPPELAGKPLFK